MNRKNRTEAAIQHEALQALQVLVETKSFSATVAALPGLTTERLVALLRTFLPETPGSPESQVGTERQEGPRHDDRNIAVLVAGQKTILFTDGASRGNPGLAGAGYLVTLADGTVVREGKRFLGERTNNEAEYDALIDGLQLAQKLGCRELEVRADSQLMIRQLTGHYRVKNQRLIPLVLAVKKLAAAFDRISYVHIPRSDNQLADALANQAIDAVLKK